jgi:protein SCO1
MVSISRRAALGLAMTVLFPSPALPHSLKDVEQQVHDKEKYFQPVDSEAPGFTLQDADGRVVRLTDFKGRVVVLNFIYINCPDFCPLQSEKIAEIQEMMNITPMKTQVQFITITTDPKHDTGQVLRDYGDNHGLDPVNWIFLTAAPGQAEDTTRKVAESYGLKFVETENGAQMHGVVTHVIDQDGRLRARFHGLTFAPLNLIVYTNALVNNVQMPHADDEPGFWAKLKEMF